MRYLTYLCALLLYWVPETAFADECRDVYIQCLKRTGLPPACSNEYTTCKKNGPSQNHSSVQTEQKVTSENPISWRLQITPDARHIDVLVNNSNHYFVKDRSFDIEFKCANGKSDIESFRPRFLVDHVGATTGYESFGRRPVCDQNGGVLTFNRVTYLDSIERRDSIALIDAGATKPRNRSCQFIHPCDGTGPTSDTDEAKGADVEDLCVALIAYRNGELATDMDEAFKAQKLGVELRDLWAETKSESYKPTTAEQLRLLDRSIRTMEAISSFIKKFLPDGGVSADLAKKATGKAMTIAEAMPKELSTTEMVLEVIDDGLTIGNLKSGKDSVDFLKENAVTMGRSANELLFRKFRNIRTILRVQIDTLDVTKQLIDASENDKVWEETVERLESDMDRINAELKKWSDYTDESMIKIEVTNTIKNAIDEKCSQNLVPNFK